ncbi:MAG: hypothetical protein ACOH14_10840 [Rhodoglobus sp.]
MNFGQRILAVVASAAVLTLSLGACTLFDDTSSNAGISQLNPVQQRAFNDTANAVRLIRGVESVSSSATTADVWGDEISLDVTVSPTVSDASVRAIAATLRHSFDRNELATVPIILTLRTDGARNGTFEQRNFDLSDDAVSSNFSYWRAVQAATGTELRMELSLSPQGDDRYLRFLSSPPDVAAADTMDHFVENFDALAAVPDVNVDKSYTIWVVDGFQSTHTLPPVDVVTLVDDIRTIIPLNGNSAEGLLSAAGGESLEGVVVYWAPPDGVLPATEVSINRTQFREPDWLAAIDVAIRASAESDVSVQYIAGTKQFRLLMSACEGNVATTSDDEKFFDAVRDSGAALSPDAAPGLCLPKL